MRKIQLTLLISLISVVSLFSQTTILVPQDYSTITTALNQVTPLDTVLVSPGTYFENIVWPDIQFNIVLKSTEGPENTIIDGSGENERVIRFDSFNNENINHNTKVDGFTIQNGNGGISVRSGSPTFRNLIVEDNVLDTIWSHGGGILLNGASRVENCIIQNNTCSGTWSFGGGIYLDFDSSAEITDCRIINNTVNGDSWNFGGGVYVQSGFGTFMNCHFEGNSANGGSWTDGTAIYISDILSSNQTVEITNSVFTKNYSDEFASSIMIDEASLLMRHCTSYKNSEGIRVRDSELELVNSILVNEGDEITENEWFDNIITVSHSLVSGGFVGTENISGDPGFISDDLLIPNINSACIAHGDLAHSPDFDITGADRPAPEGTRPDIGAYEIGQEARIAKIRFYNDENENGIQDNGEYFVGTGAIVLNDSEYFVNTSPEGFFVLLEEGSNTISWDDVNSGLWSISTGPDTYTLDANGTQFFEEVSFGIRPVRIYRDLSTGIYASVLVCNRAAVLEATVKNRGTTSQSGTLWLEIDERMELEFAEVDPDYVDGNTIGWTFTDLVPGGSITRKINLGVPAGDPSNQDDEYFFRSEVTLDDDPSFSIEFLYADIIRCAYDPNDKLVNPQRGDNLSLIDSDLIYTVRFQNVGNYYAEDVRVQDTLDSNLDMNSFQLLATSHRESLQLSVDNHIVHFNFEGIFLPDSTTNLAGSNGYVMYSVRADSTIAENTQIENTAHIYFDFNDAIVTNTTENIMVKEFPMISATNDEELLNIKVYPNPSLGTFHFSEEIDFLELYDMRGKKLLVEEKLKSVQLSGFQPGMYLAKVRKEGKRGLVKLVLVD